MGRPLGKKFFGDPVGSGIQIKIRADLGAGAVDAWIVKQTGTGRYIASNGTLTHEVKLTDVIKKVGDATIQATKVSGSTFVRTLNRHTVMTFDDKIYKWSFDAPTNSGEVQIPGL